MGHVYWAGCLLSVGFVKMDGGVHQMCVKSQVRKKHEIEIQTWQERVEFFQNSTWFVVVKLAMQQT